MIKYLQSVLAQLPIHRQEASVTVYRPTIATVKLAEIGVQACVFLRAQNFFESRTLTTRLPSNPVRSSA